MASYIEFLCIDLKFHVYVSNINIHFKNIFVLDYSVLIILVGFRQYGSFCCWYEIICGDIGIFGCWCGIICGVGVHGCC